MAPAWAPTPDQVAALLRAYTRGAETGAEVPAGELGRFTATTRPTLEAVEEIIGIACGEVAAGFEGRQPCRPDLQESARTAALYRACQLVCASYFPEATRGETSAFEAFASMYDGASRTVWAAVVARCPLDPDDPDDDGGALAPVGAGPALRFPKGVDW